MKLTTKSKRKPAYYQISTTSVTREFSSNSLSLEPPSDIFIITTEYMIGELCVDGVKYKVLTRGEKYEYDYFKTHHVIPDKWIDPDPVKLKIKSKCELSPLRFSSYEKAVEFASKVLKGSVWSGYITVSSVL